MQRHVAGGNKIEGICEKDGTVTPYKSPPPPFPPPAPLSATQADVDAAREEGKTAGKRHVCATLARMPRNLCAESVRTIFMDLCSQFLPQFPRPPLPSPSPPPPPLKPSPPPPFPPPPPLPTPPSPSPPGGFTQADVDAAREEGRLAGLLAGRREVCQAKPQRAHTLCSFPPFPPPPPAPPALAAAHAGGLARFSSGKDCAANGCADLDRERECRDAANVFVRAGLLNHGFASHARFKFVHRWHDVHDWWNDYSCKYLSSSNKFCPENIEGLSYLDRSTQTITTGLGTLCHDEEKKPCRSDQQCVCRCST